MENEGKFNETIYGYKEQIHAMNDQCQEDLHQCQDSMNSTLTTLASIFGINLDSPEEEWQKMGAVLQKLVQDTVVQLHKGTFICRGAFG